MVEMCNIGLKLHVSTAWHFKSEAFRPFWSTQLSNWHPLICTYIEDAIVHCPTSLSNFPLRQKPTYLHYFPLLLLGNWSKKSFFHRWFPVLLNSLRHTTCWNQSYISQVHTINVGEILQHLKLFVDVYLGSLFSSLCTVTLTLYLKTASKFGYFRNFQYCPDCPIRPKTAEIQDVFLVFIASLLYLGYVTLVETRTQT